MSSTRKTTKKRKTGTMTAKPAVKAQAATPAAPVPSAAPVSTAVPAAAPEVKVVTPAEDTRFLKKHLLEKVAERSGVRKNEVRPILDAVLAELGEAFAEDAEMVLQPLGKVMVKQVKDVKNATVYTCRIRRSTAQSGDAATDTSVSSA